MLPHDRVYKENGPSIKNLSGILEPSLHPLLVDAEEPGTADYARDSRWPTVVKGARGWIHGQGANVAFYDGSVKYKINPTWTSLRGFGDLP
jgi:prepilin-type processing-associated H-X9-DG protein